MPNKPDPYAAFNFLVQIADDTEKSQTLGGFSEVSGLSTSLDVVDDRSDYEKPDPVLKLPGLHKFADITLKRGVVDGNGLAAWMANAASNLNRVRRTVTITLRGEAGKPVRKWILREVVPVKFTSPALVAKGGDVAIYELLLCSEGVTLES